MKIQSSPTMRRMPTYLHRVFQLQSEGAEWVSCAELAAYMEIPHIVVRKDIAMTGLAGNRRRGFRTAELIDAILAFVGWDQPVQATLVGAGSLGSALLGYRDFQSYNFNISSVFDSNPEKVGKTIHGLVVRDIATMAEVLAPAPPKVAIICVPDSVAQRVADQLISLNIRYLWNFANVCLEVPQGIIVQREVIAGGLAVLSAKIKKCEAGEPIPED